MYFIGTEPALRHEKGDVASEDILLLEVLRREPAAEIHMHVERTGGHHGDGPRGAAIRAHTTRAL